MNTACLVFAAAVSVVGLGARAAVIEVTQNHRSFSPAAVDIEVGDTIRIVNNDEFIHNVYVESPTFNFDSEEQEPGHTQEIVFTKPGDFEVHCHIHLKMKLDVHVHTNAGAPTSARPSRQ